MQNNDRCDRMALITMTNKQKEITFKHRYKQTTMMYKKTTPTCDVNAVRGFLLTTVTETTGVNTAKEAE